MSLGAKKLNSVKTSTTAKGVLSKAVLSKTATKGGAAKPISKPIPKVATAKPAAATNAQKIVTPSRAALVNKPNGTAKVNGGGNMNGNGKAHATQLAARPAVAQPVAIDPRFEPFRVLLEAKRAELAGSLGDTRFGAQAQNGRVAEEDQAAVSHEEFISSKRNSLEFRMLRLVHAALDRINRGEYGICHACEEDISEKRLKAIPWAEFCVRCQDSHAANYDDSGDSVTPGAAPALQVWNW